MPTETIQRIKDRIDRAPSLSEEDRRDISALIDQLGEDIEALSEASIEDGQSLAGFTELSIHEATRAQADNDLLQIGLQGVRGVVARLEERHPGLAAIANDIATTLSGMGF